MMMELQKRLKLEDDFRTCMELLKSRRKRELEMRLDLDMDRKAGSGAKPTKIKPKKL